jgi:hypothetical protein
MMRCKSFNNENNYVQREIFFPSEERQAIKNEIPSDFSIIAELQIY